MDSILVAIDFDRYTEKLVAFGAKFANAFNAKLWLIHIAPDEPEFIGYDQGPQYIRDGFAKELREEHKKLQALCDKLRTQGLDAEGLMVQGPTIEMIVEEAKKLKAELIITGTHQHNFFYKAFIGSVSSELLERAELPLLMYPCKG